MANRRKILLFYNHLSSFVKKDIEILRQEFDVETHDFFTDSKWKTPFRYLSQLFFLISRIGKANLLIAQFAGHHSLLPGLLSKITGKPYLIVVGGTDAHYFPHIGYGNWQRGLLRRVTEASFKLCSHIAPKHRSLMKSEYTYDTQEPADQGIYARLPELKVPFTEIANGYDSEKWRCIANKKRHTFITVSGAWEYSFLQQLKGIDLILEVAPQFPDSSFVILGVPSHIHLNPTSSNVKVLPPAKNEDLISIFSECEFYLQLSMAEGFPNAICEAMLCECVPIGSSVFSIPEIIGDTGFVLKKRDASQLKTLIVEALISDKTALGKKARKKIETNYSLDKRKQRLLELCHRLGTP